MSTVAAEWADLPLDSRILEALQDLKWKTPTTVQGVCVPLALKGKDVSIQSRTGSGKTGAFVIPVIQRIITEREQKGKKGVETPVALLLVPSLELCEQTTEAIRTLAKYVKPRLVVENLTSGGAVTASRVSSAHILVSTVALLASSIRHGTVSADTVKHLRFLVLDEADMIVSMAEQSLRTVQAILPSSMQVILSSATLTEGTAAIKGQLLRNPTSVVLTTDEVDDAELGAADAEGKAGPIVESRITLRDPQKKTLNQYYQVATDGCHRHTLLYGLYRFGLIKGKTLIFVDEVDDTYRLQHFLEQLGVATLVYDANLPMNVRLDALKRFQSGQVSAMVCTDGTLESAEKLQMSLQHRGEEEDGEAAEPPTRKRRREGGGNASSKTKSRSQSSSALHRGIDFSNVRNVILFDGVDALSPIALSRYTHRIGRAGRAGQEGLSIAFFSVPQARRCLFALREYGRSKGDKIEPFKAMKRDEAAKLQYRVDSALDNVTRAATRRLRVASVAAELGRSSYLANHLSQRDTAAIHRVVKRSAGKVRIERNLLDVPEYMKVENVEDASEYTHRVRADQTQSQKFKKAIAKPAADPLKAVVSKLKSNRKQ